jgi:hypothetical protein
MTIVRGHANGGAGMLFISSSAAITDVVFAFGVSDGSTAPTAPAQRSAGGGVSLYNSSASFTDVTFRHVCSTAACVLARAFLPSRACATLHAFTHRSGNLAGDTGGGAVFAEMGSNATFTNCLAVNNTHFAAGKVRAGVLVGGASQRKQKCALCQDFMHN